VRSGSRARQHRNLQIAHGYLDALLSGLALVEVEFGVARMHICQQKGHPPVKICINTVKSIPMGTPRQLIFKGQ
jgi:hypothetical protein